MSSPKFSPPSSPVVPGSTRPRGSTLAGWHLPTSWFERQRSYEMPEVIRLCRLNSNQIYTVEEYGDLELFWNPTFHRTRLDCIPDIRPANFAQAPDAVKAELHRSVSDPTYLESIQIAKANAEREQLARLAALRGNPDPKDPFMKAVREEDWERTFPTPPTPPPSPARAFPTSSPEERKRLPKPRYSWFGFGPAVVPERYQFVGAAEQPSKVETPSTPGSILGKHARDSGDKTDDDAEFERKLKRRVMEAGKMGWIAATKGFAKKWVRKIGDQLTIAAFMVLCSVLFFLAVMGAGLWVVVAQLQDIAYGQEEMRDREVVEVVEEGEGRRQTLQDREIDTVVGEGRDWVVDGAGVAAEALETYSRWLQSFVTRHPRYWHNPSGNYRNSDTTSQAGINEA